jgi:hypothetical protein
MRQSLRFCVAGDCVETADLNFDQWYHVCGIWDPYNKIREAMGGGRYVFLDNVRTYAPSTAVVPNKPSFLVGIID